MKHTFKTVLLSLTFAACLSSCGGGIDYDARYRQICEAFTKQEGFDKDSESIVVDEGYLGAQPAILKVFAYTDQAKGYREEITLMASVREENLHYQTIYFSLWNHNEYTCHVYLVDKPIDKYTSFGRYLDRVTEYARTVTTLKKDYKRGDQVVYGYVSEGTIHPTNEMMEKERPITADLIDYSLTKLGKFIGSLNVPDVGYGLRDLGFQNY